MLSSSEPSPSPQTMLRPHAGRCSVISDSPATRWLPQIIACDQAYEWLPITVDGTTLLESQDDPTGACGLMERASVDGTRHFDLAGALR